MPFNRCGKFLNDLVNGGNNSDELGESRISSAGRTLIGVGVAGAGLAIATRLAAAAILA